MLTKNIQRAALFAAALFILASGNKVSAENKLKKAETAKDIIEKAYNLSLQKDRTQAINILVNAIKQETGRGSSVADLKKALQQISYVFFSEKAQQQYELALSLRRTDPAQAQQKITEALRSEPDNLNLFNEMQRLLLVKNDCSSVLENVTKQRLQDPYDENLQLLQGQATACLNQWLDFRKLVDQVEIKKSPLAKYWLSLEADNAIADKNQIKLKDIAGQLQKLDNKYPEQLYYSWRAASLMEKKKIGLGYVKECKNLSANLYRQYMTDPNLCRRVAEVETANNND